MIQDPYKILELPPGASQDDIKKAYRKKTKECHPDIHPDDPNAERKMAEINEAYDMLMNPEKYEKQKAQQSGRNGQGSYYGGYSQGQGRYGGYSQGQGQYGGWSKDFRDFDFGDIFGFGFDRNEQIPRPQVQPGDSPEIQRAILAINNGHYQSAINILNGIASGGRNGRWYYLGAFANNGAGNTITALEQIQKAVLLEPANEEYQRLKQNFEQTSRSYRQAGSGYGADPAAMQRFCMGLCFMNFCCPLCCFM